MLYVKESNQTTPVTDRCEITYLYQDNKIVGITEIYTNKIFKTYTSKYINHYEVVYKPIGTTGIYYGKFSNFTILKGDLYASQIYSCQFNIQNSGIIWATCPTLNSTKQSVDGYILQYGTDTSRTTWLNVSVVGKLS